ncbi:Ubiquitin fusion degradation protein 4 [Phlyctochytrium planicorne]|nr:Ubiquitin fusion degradation protein 4 [Phlyctochytrium planicorne]
MSEEDGRFDRIKRDPRFARPKKNENKVVIDPRFQGVFDSEEFGSTTKDRYGRKTKRDVGSDMKRFYRLEDKGEEEEDEEIDEEEGSRLIRGEVLMESSDEEDDAEVGVDAGMEEEEEEEEDEKVERGPPARRFAVVNMDWDNVKASDLWKAFEGFTPKNGQILSVAIIPSDFGKERIEREEREGPPADIFKADDDINKPLFYDDEQADFDDTLLRKYQLERLKYYYALVECDTVATATAIVEGCDGAEFEKSANFLDLRYVPDGMEFENEPRERITEPPAIYIPADFTTNALQHSKVKLTWDEDDPERVRVTRRKFNKDEIKDMDFKSYLASSSESESEAEEERSRKYKQLLLGGGDEEEFAEPEKGEDDVDMEITFTPGLSEAVAETVEKKRKEKTETVFEAKMRMKREKRKEKNAEKKRLRKGSDSEKEDEFFASNTSKTKKIKTGKETAEQKAKAKAELELILMDENNKQPKHFDMREIIKQEKMSKNKKKKKYLDELEHTQDDFELDIKDPRFSQALTSYQYAIDPTNPNFKKTKAMEKLLAEKRKIGSEGSEEHRGRRDVEPAVQISKKDQLKGLVDSQASSPVQTRHTRQSKQQQESSSSKAVPTTKKRIRATQSTEDHSNTESSVSTLEPRRSKRIALSTDSSSAPSTPSPSVEKAIGSSSSLLKRRRSEASSAPAGKVTRSKTASRLTEGFEESEKPAEGEARQKRKAAEVASASITTILHPKKKAGVSEEPLPTSSSSSRKATATKAQRAIMSSDHRKKQKKSSVSSEQISDLPSEDSGSSSQPMDIRKKAEPSSSSKKRKDKKSAAGGAAARGTSSSYPSTRTFDDESDSSSRSLKASSLFNASSMGMGGGSGFGMPFFGVGSSRGPQTSGRFADILNQLNQRGNHGVQLVALQDLAELLSVATEDMFVGHGSRMSGFNSDDFIKALCGILSSSANSPGGDLQEFAFDDGFDAGGFGGSALLPDLMLMSCRCLLNLIEANPPCLASIVHNGCVELLVAKLMEIEYIDLAEVSLSVLNKVAVDYPAAVIKANGLMACLQFIDFFSLHVQRTSMTIVANACRGLSSISPITADGSSPTRNSISNVVATVKEIIPTLERLLTYSDERLLDQAVKSVIRIVEWCWRSERVLEQMCTASLLDAVLSRVNPASLAPLNSSTPVSATNGPQSSGSSPLFINLVRILSCVARGSPKLAFTLLSEKNVLEVIVNIFTGGVPVSNQDLNLADDLISKAVTNTIVNQPAEQIVEVLTLAYELLPGLPKDKTWSLRINKSKASISLGSIGAAFSRRRQSGDGNSDSESAVGMIPSDTARLELLSSHKEVAALFSQKLLPILVDVFGTSVSPPVRKRCVECVARAIWHNGDSEGLFIILKGMKTFGKFIAELLQLHEAIFQPADPQGSSASVPNADDSNEALSVVGAVAANDRTRREALFFVSAGLQIVSVVLEKCGARSREWLSREGVSSHIAKIVETVESSSDTDSESQSQKTAISPSKMTEEPARELPGDPEAAARFSELLKDLKRMKEQVAAVGKSPGASPNSIQTTLGEAAELLEKVEKAEKALVQSNESRGIPYRKSEDTASQMSASSSSSRSESSPKRAPNLNLNTKGASGSMPADSETSPTGFVLSGMKKMLERLTRGVQGSSGAAGSSSTPSESGEECLPSPLGKDYQSPIVGLNGERFTEKEIKLWMIHAGKKLLGVFGGTVVETPVLVELRNAALILKAVTPMILSGKDSSAFEGWSLVDDPLLLNVLHRIAEHFAGVRCEDDNVGVTGYELFESGIMDGLIYYLSTPAIGETVVNFPPTHQEARHTAPIFSRLRSFLHVFLNGPSPDSRNLYVPRSFSNLVNRLQETLSRVERFTVAHAIPSQGNQSMGKESFLSFMGSLLMGHGGQSSQLSKDAATPAMQLTRQIRLRLHAEDPNAVPQHLRELVISIHAVSTFKNLEDYLRNRVGIFKNNINETISPSRQAQIEDEDDNDENEEDDDEEDDEEERYTENNAPVAEGDAASQTKAFEERLDREASDVEEANDYPDEDGDEDEDLGQQSFNLSDLLLASEETRRLQRRGEDPEGASPGATNISFGSQPHSAVFPTPPSSSVRSQSTPSQHQPTSYAFKFSIGDFVASPEQTIFGFLYSFENLEHRRAGRRKGNFVPAPNIWTNFYTVNFGRAPVMSQTSSNLFEKRFDEKSYDSVMEGDGPSADAHVPTSSVKAPFSLDMPKDLPISQSPGNVIFLFRILHALNTRWTEVFEEAAATVRPMVGTDPHKCTSAVPDVLGTAAAAEGPQQLVLGSTPLTALVLNPLAPTEFINSKLTAKLTRQLDEPLIVACNVLPSWCSMLARDFSFLVPFDSRLVYLQSTSFGFSRSLGRWQGLQQSNNGNGRSSASSSSSRNSLVEIGRLQRQKVRISRSRIVESMLKVMELYGSSQMLLEVEFFDEVGTGLGPTLEFYALVCKEIRKRDGIYFPGPVKLSGFVTGPRPSNLTAGLRPPLPPPAVQSQSQSSATSPPSVSGDSITSTGTQVPTSPVQQVSSGSENVVIWRDDGVDIGSEDISNDVRLYLNPPGGLFPAPMSLDIANVDRGRKILSLFRSLGVFVAKALLDSRIVDMPFSPLFLEMVVGEEDEDRCASIAAHGNAGRLASELHLLKHVDPVVYNSLLEMWNLYREKRAILANPDLTESEKQARIAGLNIRNARIEDFGLDFTLPGYPDIELVKDGRNLQVDINNVGLYIERIVDFTVGGGVRRQVDAFRSGFNRVFPVEDLKSFSVQELCVLIGGNKDEDWSLEVLVDSIRADHGYTSDSRAVRFLAEMMHGFSPADRRDFLMFVTGSPKLPIGGFKALSPPLTVVCKTVDESGSVPGGVRNKADDYLPSVMTCVNYLKVPDYSSLEVMTSRFRTAVREGQGCFHLS